MTPTEAIQALQQFERLDDEQVGEIVELIREIQPKHCKDCRHDFVLENQYPCDFCKWNHFDKWEAAQ